MIDLTEDLTIIFLDIDGVFQSNEYYERVKDEDLIDYDARHIMREKVELYKYTFKFDDFLDSDYGNEYMKNMINKREQTINDCERYIAEIEELFNQQFGVYNKEIKIIFI